VAKAQKANEFGDPSFFARAELFSRRWHQIALSLNSEVELVLITLSHGFWGDFPVF
jgi:hypothetical protein